MDQNVKKRIEKEAKKLFEDQLPILIAGEVKGYPATISEVTRRIIDEKAAQLRDYCLRNPEIWPQWFKLKVSKEAQKQADERTDETFWSNVNLRADQEIMQRLPTAWKSFLKEIATPFVNNTLQAQLLKLATSLEYICPKCGNNIQITLTPNDISLMLQRGWILVVCPYAKGFFKHNFRFYLGELFWHIMKGDVIPVSTIKYRPVKNNH